VKKRFHLTRKNKFAIGLGVLLFMYSFPLYVSIAPSTFAAASRLLFISVCSAVFAVAGLLLYKLTIKNVKIDYPLTSPSGQVDVYAGNTIPRPIYEDMQRYPWFFRKKRNRKKIEKGKSDPTK
jgi:hypothetical protein